MRRPRLLTVAMSGALLGLLTLPGCSSFDAWAQYEPVRVVHRESDGLVVRVGLRGIDVEIDRAVVLIEVVNDGAREAIVAPEAVTISTDDGLLLRDTLSANSPATVVLLPGGRSEWRVDCASPDERRVLDIPMTDPVVVWSLAVGERVVSGRAEFELCDPPHLQDEPFQ